MMADLITIGILLGAVPLAYWCGRLSERGPWQRCLKQLKGELETAKRYVEVQKGVFAENRRKVRELEDAACTNWKHGWAICRVCSFRWVAVRPACADALECPACHELAGEEAGPEEV